LTRLRTREGDARFADGDDEGAADAWTLALDGSEEPLGREHLGPLVGLAQVGELPATDAEALIAQLEDGAVLAKGEAEGVVAHAHLAGRRLP
jgi:hypothetical protein